MWYPRNNQWGRDNEKYEGRAKAESLLCPSRVRADLNNLEGTNLIEGEKYQGICVNDTKMGGRGERLRLRSQGKDAFISIQLEYLNTYTKLTTDDTDSHKVSLPESIVEEWYINRWYGPWEVQSRDECGREADSTH